MTTELIKDLVFAFLISASPAGEAKVGVPVALAANIHPILTFFICVIGNLTVFPLTFFLLKRVNTFFFRYRGYKRQAIKLAKRAKKQTAKTIEKYGFWGLMIFVMIPLPATGAYIGSIAAWIFNIDRRTAFYSVSLGVVISTAIITAAGWLIQHFTAI